MFYLYAASSSQESANLDEFYDTELENLTTYSVDKVAGKSKTFLLVGRTRSFTREKPSICWKWLWKIFVKFVNRGNRTVSAGSNDLAVRSASFLRRYFIPAPQISNRSCRTACPSPSFYSSDPAPLPPRSLPFFQPGSPSASTSSNKRAAANRGTRCIARSVN